MIRRIRQRRALKRALAEEALKLAAELREAHRALRLARSRTRASMESHLSSSPTCPTCGSQLWIRTAKVKGYNGRQFWGCSRYKACLQKPIELAVYPKAAFRKVSPKASRKLAR